MTSRILVCPKCKARYDAANLAPGTRIYCKKCKAVFKVPAKLATVKEVVKDELVGRTIGGFKILSKIAEGGIGAVYKAKQLSLDRIVAFKTLKREFATNKEVLARLNREARAAAKLVDPNVVQTYDVGEDQGVNFIAMEFVEGESLQDAMNREGKIDVRRALDVLLQAASALKAAHQMGIIHRDIKPDNLMITKSGVVKLSDFGLAKQVEADVAATQSGTIVGTPRYMSPEQAEGKTLDARTDIYSLGGTIYHAVAGVPPFEAPTAMGVIIKHINENLPPVRKLNPKVTPKVAAIIEKMMAKNPEDRYSSASELIESVKDAIATFESDSAAIAKELDEAETVPSAEPPPLPAPSPPADTPAAEPKPGKKRWKGVAVAGLGLLLFLVVLSSISRNKARREQDRQFAARFEELRKEAYDLSQEDKYQAAMDVFNEFMGDDVPASWRQKAEDTRKDFERYAKEKYAKVVASAEQDLKEGDGEKAKWQYEQVIENYGLPDIVEDARSRLAEISRKELEEVTARLKKVERLLSGSGADEKQAREELSRLQDKFRRTRLPGDLEETLGRITDVLKRKERAPRVLRVAKGGKAEFRTIGAALGKALGGETIEIMDSEVYEETSIWSLKYGITLRGAGPTPPTIRPALKGKMRYGFGGMYPLIMAHRDWKLENLIIDGNGKCSGVMCAPGGRVSMSNCVVMNTLGPGLSVGDPRPRGFRRHAGPGRKEGTRCTVDITDCALLNCGARKLPAVRVDLTGMRDFSFKFDHNLILGAKCCFQWFGDSDGTGDVVVTNSIFGRSDVFMLSEVRNFQVRIRFDWNCYDKTISLFLIGRDKMKIASFDKWREEIDSDRHSIVADPLFVAPAKGDFTLAENSPCRGKGFNGTDMGPLKTTKLSFFRPPEPPPKPHPPVAAPPAKPKEEEVDPRAQKLAELIRANEFEEAVAFLENMPEDPPQRRHWKRKKMEHLGRILALKEKVTDRINQQHDVKVGVIVGKRDKALIGGVYSSADREALVITARDGAQHRIPWNELSTDEFCEICSSSIEGTDHLSRLALGVYLFECGDLDKAEKKLELVRAAMRSGPERRLADGLLSKIRQLKGEPE